MATAGNNNESKYLLVSDSDEINSQFDSKKVSLDELTELTQEELFSNHLRIMSKYLTINQYQMILEELEQKLEQQRESWNNVKDMQWSGKFTVVDGQIILIRKEQAQTKKNALEILRSNWNIPNNYSVSSISGCMLRGMTEVAQSGILGSENQKLEKKNIPNHMHQSAITSGSNIKCVKESQTKNLGDVDQSERYDIFKNDSLATGLQKNELQGVVDKFIPQQTGNESITHNNMPLYDSFYAFLISKIS